MQHKQWWFISGEGGKPLRVPGYSQCGCGG